MKPTVSPLALAAYLAHVVAGQTVRGIALATGVEPSTVTRRVRMVENLRESPEWDEILSALEADYLGHPRHEPITGARVLSALDVTREGLCEAILSSMGALKSPGAAIVTGSGMDGAPILDGRANPTGTQLARADVLAAFAVGWLREVPSSATGARRFRLSDRAREAFPPGCPSAAISAALAPGLPVRVADMAKRAPDIFTPHRQRAAVAVHVAFLSGRAAPLGDLPPVVFETLASACRDGAGLEEIERAQGWCQRSGKVALAICLDVAAARLGVQP